VTNELWKPPVAGAAGEGVLYPYKTAAALGYGVAAILDGVAESAPSAPMWKSFVIALPMATAATMWCIVDAASRGGYYPHSFRWLTMFTWPIAVPVYLIRSRGFMGGLVAMGVLFATWILSALGHLAGGALYAAH
jgi:hypothetical protein